jgi:ABC-type iron transport system FetAB permease component
VVWTTVESAELLCAEGSRIRLCLVRETAILVIRASRAGYGFAGLFLLLAVVLLVIIQSRGVVHSSSDAILASFVIGSVVLLAISYFLSAVVARVVVDGNTVQVRDRLGRHRRFARAEISRAAMRSISAPTVYGPSQPTAFLLVSRDGRCLVRLPESDYGTEALERLTTTLGLTWPHTEHASLRAINHEFPGAYVFDYQTIVVAIVILVVALAIAAFALLMR